MSKANQAVERFNQGFGCAQSIFVVYRNPAQIDENTALKLSSMLGGGVCGSGSGLCGAASGALLALSAQHGLDEPASGEAKAATYALGQGLLKRFGERMGGCHCEGVLGMNIGSAEYKAQAKVIRATRCVEAVRTAAQLLEEHAVFGASEMNESPASRSA